MNSKWKWIALVAGIPATCIGAIGFIAGLLLVSEGTGTYEFTLWIIGLYITLGCGLALLLHAIFSLRNQPSKPARLPPLWVLVWGLVLCAGLGWAVFDRPSGSWVFPPVFLLAAALPPLAALSWGSERQAVLTWRQIILCFVLGSTAAVVLAIILETALPAVVMVFIQELFDQIGQNFSSLLGILSEGRISSELSSRYFMYYLVELAVIAPLAEELVKPLVVLPLLRHARNSRQAFWIGAAAGAGFAFLENIIYTMSRMSSWVGILALRALSAAIHPLGAGLVGLGWYELFHSTDQSGWVRLENWLKRFGAAAGIHALWNGGSAVILTLVSTGFFSKAGADVDLFGVTFAGIGLAFLVIVEGGALLAFRYLAQKPVEGDAYQFFREGGLSPISQPQSRSLALWAAACLLAILPLLVEALNSLPAAQP